MKTRYLHQKTEIERERAIALLREANRLFPELHLAYAEATADNTGSPVWFESPAPDGVLVFPSVWPPA